MKIFICRFIVPYGEYVYGVEAESVDDAAERFVSEVLQKDDSYHYAHIAHHIDEWDKKDEIEWVYNIPNTHEHYTLTVSELSLSDGWCWLGGREE